MTFANGACVEQCIVSAMSIGLGRREDLSAGCGNQCAQEKINVNNNCQAHCDPEGLPLGLKRDVYSGCDNQCTQEYGYADDSCVQDCVVLAMPLGVRRKRDIATKPTERSPWALTFDDGPASATWPPLKRSEMSVSSGSRSSKGDVDSIREDIRALASRRAAPIRRTKRDVYEDCDWHCLNAFGLPQDTCMDECVANGGSI